MVACPNCGNELEAPGQVCPACEATLADNRLTDFADGAFPPVNPGEVLEGKWRVERRLGQGGMGTVVLGHDLSLDRKVAVKLLSGTLCQDDDSVARFEKEARLTAKLEHPNIIPVYAVGRHGKRPFIVMKYLDGMPLSKYLRVTPLPLPEAEVLSILRQICDGVELVHENGFVHRDIKPANIFIGPTGHATLLDFGILKDTGHSLTNVGSVLGTPAYLAPEVLRGDPIDHRADLFALGVVLYEVLSGSRPYPAPTLEAAEIQMRTEAPRIRERAPWITDAVAAVVQRAVQRDPGKRYQSAGALWNALKAAYSGEAPAPVPSSSKRGWLAGLGALCALGLVFGAWRWMKAEPPPAPPEPVVATAPVIAPPKPEPAPEIAPRLHPPPVAPPAVPVRPVAVSRRPSHTEKPHLAKAPAPAVEAGPPGTLKVVTTESGQSSWANLEVDGTSRGGTPVVVELPAGHHHVRVERPGFQSIERDIEVVSGDQTSLRLDLVQ